MTSVSIKDGSLTVGELGDLSSPRAIVYSRIKCIKELFVKRIKCSLRERR